MKFRTVNAKVKDIPFISETNAKALFEFIIKTKPDNVLELGVAHGTSSCYIAAALDEIGRGQLTCVDLELV
jgi:predicted O-methyltransferase YrrM